MGRPGQAAHRSQAAAVVARQAARAEAEDRRKAREAPATQEQVAMHEEANEMIS